MTAPHPNYAIKNRQIIAETDHMRMTQFRLGPGESIPWHLHTEVTDWHICLEGEMRVETSPGSAVDLSPGGRHDVPPKTAHRIVNSGSGDCCFIIVQGVGAYDFLPLED